MVDDTTPSQPKLASSPPELVVPTDGKLGSCAVTQSSSYPSSNENALLVVDRSSATATATERVLMNDFLLRNITSYLPNEHLMEVACVSTRWNHSIPRATTYESRAPGTIITVLQLCPSPHSKYPGKDGVRGRLEQLIHQLQQLCGRDPNVLQQYQHVSMKDYQEFQFNEKYFVSSECKYKALLHQIKTNGPRIEGITSLDFCFTTTPKPSFGPDAHYVLRTLSYLFPSLQQVDLTNTYVGDLTFVPNLTVQLFFENCPLLEKLTVNNRGFALDGTAMKTADNLKELTMDDSRFLIDGSTLDAMSDLDTDHETVSKKQFLFHGCSSNVLERVSMSNTQICFYGRGREMFEAIPQNALIKFIRKAPSTLRWFRSNLTQENIKIVQQERPEIEFVS